MSTGYSQRQLGPALIFLGATILLLLIFFVLRLNGAEISTSSPRQTPLVKPVFPDEADVVLKQHSGNSDLIDVYLKEYGTGAENLYLSLPELASTSTEPVQYTRGMLYAHHERKNNAGEHYQQIIRYDRNGNRDVLYTNLSFSFQLARFSSGVGLSQDPIIIAVINRDSVHFLNADGTVRRTMDIPKQYDTESTALPLSYFSLGASHGFLWLGITERTNLHSIEKIDLATYQSTLYDVSALHIPNGDLALNGQIDVLAYSDYPSFPDEDDYSRFVQEKTPVNLRIYDLVSEETALIDTSEAKRFNPGWDDIYTLQYDNPRGEGRTSHDI